MSLLFLGEFIYEYAIQNSTNISQVEILNLIILINFVMFSYDYSF